MQRSPPPPWRRRSIPLVIDLPREFWEDKDRTAHIWGLFAEAFASRFGLKMHKLLTDPALGASMLTWSLTKEGSREFLKAKQRTRNEPFYYLL